MKINSELIQASNHFINPLNERQLDLRGKKISAIENLGATLDFFDHIDLGDNEIKKLGNLTLLKRLRTLNLSNNRISKIIDVSESLPALENLILMNNRLADFSEMYSLRNCKKLKRLILHGNLITQQPKYRLQIISILPQLKVLDFNKITHKVFYNFNIFILFFFKQNQEKEEAKEFQTEEQQDYLKLINLKDGNFDEQMVKKLIENAKSFEQLNQLDQLMKLHKGNGQQE